MDNNQIVTNYDVNTIIQKHINLYTETALINNINISCSKFILFIKDDFSLTKFVESLNCQYLFFTYSNVLIRINHCIIDLYRDSGDKDIRISVYGESSNLKITMDLLKNHSDIIERRPYIKWIYNQKNEAVNVPINQVEARNSFYPWLNKPMSDWINDYLSSNANILILIDPEDLSWDWP